ncbi:MAG: hypothetical protein ACP5II_05490 [Infirmifilum sp.]|jgi:hypothetical protein|nr:hypothetical protein [Infirmifilum uzonense]
MKGTITSMGIVSYANVKRVQIEIEGETLDVEIPDKLLQEVGADPRVGSEVEVELSREPGDLSYWQIVMSAETYLKQEAQGKIYASAGGLQVVIPSKILGDKIDIGEKVYLKLRF